ncbi:MAG: signal peptide peptidase SppA [Candidatus Binatia bacterium]|nr:signal peptide peptidase SppA [Candidatus Binatia bacterium]
MLWRLWLGIRLTLHYLGEALRWIAGRKRPFAVLRITLRGELREAAPSGFWSTRHPLTFSELVRTLRWAREDKRIKAVFIQCEQALLGWAQVEELHRSLLALRKAGKRVYVALGQAQAPEYVLASAADHIFLSPAGELAIHGLTAEVWFLSRALAKLGIQPEIIQVGEYKSAAEVFTATAMSAAHREAAQALVDHLLESLAAAVASGRGWEPQRAIQAIENGPYDARTALDQGLVDSLEDAIIAEAKALELTGVSRTEAIDFHAYNRRRVIELRRFWWRRRGEHVAIVHIAGSLFDGPAPRSRLTTLLHDLEQIKESPGVKAVLVRVVSPGGTAFAADRIWHALSAVAEKKPLVTSLGDVAASGGYYLAVAGRPVFAEANTITGSIGVLSGKFILRGLYEWLGIDKDRVARGQHVGLASDALPLTPEEKLVLERHARHFYERFLDIVRLGRGLESSQVDAAAHGRVWSGKAALGLGLVDAIGGFEQALDAAILLGGFDPAEPVAVIHYPRPRPFWQSLLDRVRPTPPVPLPPTHELTAGRVWAWMPVQYCIY